MSFLQTFLTESFWGRVIYHLSRHRYFRHKEELDDYIIPAKYLGGEKGVGSDGSSEVVKNELETDFALQQGLQQGLQQDKKSDDVIIVDWDGPDDPENPYNWPLLQKLIFVVEIGFLTTSVYMASAVYTPGIEEIMNDLNVGQTVATLPLALFVIGYGIGPMAFSPMSEHALFGRTSIYIITLFFFVILQIPTALVKNIAGLCILRFLSGILASPCLSTGGASVGDVITMPYMPVGIAGWAMGAVCGPSFGPLFGSILTVKANWRWTFWFMLILSGSSLLVLSFFLPETYSKTLLHRKAKRLRKITGNENIISEGDNENKDKTNKELVIEILWRPIEITLTEPVVLLINMYIALVYSIMYLWFEAFPIVFYEVYQFTLVEMGVAYVSIMVGIVIGAVFYISVMYHSFTKKLLNGQEVAPEVFIPMAICGSCIMPIGIFIFAWASSPDTHWMGSLVGAALFALGAFIIFQTLLNYLGMSFWRFIASVFAGNTLFRSVIAGCFPLFGRPLFNNLATKKYPVAWGTSILGFISLAMILIPVTFYLNGPKLRARSKYAGAGS